MTDKVSEWRGTSGLALSSGWASLLIEAQGIVLVTICIFQYNLEY